MIQLGNTAKSLHRKQRINSSAPLQGEINLCLSFSGNEQKVPKACWSPATDRTIFLSHSSSLSITIPGSLLNLSISLLTPYFLDMSTCYLYSFIFLFFFFLAVSRLFFFNSTSFFLSPTLLLLTAFLSYDVFSIHGLSLLHHRPVCFTELQREREREKKRRNSLETE